MLVLVLPLLHLRNNGVPKSQRLRLNLDQPENRFYKQQQESHSRTKADEYEKPFEVFAHAVVLTVIERIKKENHNIT
jgi:hypothetical protein